MIRKEGNTSADDVSGSARTLVANLFFKRLEQPIFMAVPCMRQGFCSPIHKKNSRESRDCLLPPEVALLKLLTQT